MGRRTRDCQSLAIAGFFAMIMMASAAPCAAQTDGVRRLDLRIENGRLTEARKVIVVKRSDRVEINWRADRRTILHLHGYNIELALRPDRVETMAFVARATGRFAIETHAPPGEEKAGHHIVLIYLEVHPR